MRLSSPAGNWFRFTVLSFLTISSTTVVVVKGRIIGSQTTKDLSSTSDINDNKETAGNRGRDHPKLIDDSIEEPTTPAVIDDSGSKNNGHNLKKHHHDRHRLVYPSLRKQNFQEAGDDTMIRISHVNKDVAATRNSNKEEHNKNILDTTNHPSLLEHPTIKNLEMVETKYYMYDDCNILQCDLLKELRERAKSTPKKAETLDHISLDAKAEIEIIEALWNHPLRTQNPEEASVFIIPLTISELIKYGCQWDDCTWFQDSFEALFQHPIFQQYQGNNHVLISQHWLSFNERFMTMFPAMGPIYRKLQNVTVAMHFDPNGCANLVKDKERTHGSGFSSLFQWESQPMTRAFSIGLIGTNDMPFQAATMEKFHNSKYFLFFHARETPFAFRSTKYRNAFFSNTTELETLPKSTIGYSIPKDEWIDGYKSSKFCLSIRGDTPHSHALLHAVRVGCIPVVVSDYYNEYAPSFKHSLSIQDWAIFIDEADFLADPYGQVRALNDLPTSFVQDKLFNISVAQSIVLSESPFFVPAFLKETITAMNLPAPINKDANAHQRRSSFSIGGKTYKYRYPNTMLGSVDLFHEAPLVVGVFSSPEHAARRQIIRESWGRDSSVFFILSGHWEDISEEFHVYGDILWMDMSKESKWHPSVIRTIQSNMFFHAMENHVESYSYAAVTNDYNYFEMDMVELIMHLYRPDFWGACTNSNEDEMSFHFGYVVSRKFNHCAVKKVDEGAVDHFMHHPDTAMAVLSEQCNVVCSDESWDHEDDGVNPIKKVTSGQDFYYIHDNLMWSKKVSPYYEGISTDAEEAEAALHMVDSAVL